MIFIVGLPVLALMVTWSAWKTKFYHSDSRFFARAGLVIGMVFIGLFVSYLSGHFIVGHEERTTSELPIVSLADATHVEGQYLLFGGSVDSVPVYRYYYRTDEGFRMGWKPVDESYIVEQESTRPRYEKVEDIIDFGPWTHKMASDTHYVFYVPPGTVTNDFNLDLEG